MSSAGTVLEHPVVTGVRDAVAGLAGACGAPTWQLSDAEVETGLASVLELEAKAAALRAGLLREAEVRDLHSRTRAPTVEHWLGDRFRLSRADAAARMRSASVLGRHPTVEAALARGEVTVEQATVVTAALDRVALLPEVSGDDRADAASFLVAQCAVLVPRDLARAGQAVVEALTVSPSEDDPADAAAVERDLARAEADAQAAERNELRVTRHRGRLRALLDLGTLGEATLLAWLRDADTPHPGEDGFEDQRPLGERRGDALVDLLATAAATAQAPQPAEPAPVSPIALLTVTTTLAELQDGLSGAGRLDTDGTLSAATLRQLACDALLVPAVLGEPSEVLDLGRTTRVWNRAQRRAVALRDRGCVAPGCDRPPENCQVHHCWHWSDGGPTDLCNAALLCGFHHRMVHRQGWEIVLAGDGYPVLIPPPTIDPGQRPRQHHRFRLTLLTGRHRE